MRSIRESDEELYCALYCDPETMRFIGPAWTRAEAARAFRGVLDATRATPPRALFLTMVPKAAQQPIGLCTLQNFDPAGRRIEMGVMVASHVRARGLASEALIAVITHAFDTMPVDEVWVRIAHEHAACERTAVIIGLVRHAEAAAGGSRQERLALVGLPRLVATQRRVAGCFCALFRCERLSFRRRLAPE